MVKEKNKKSESIHLRITEGDKKLIEKWADILNLSLADFVREAIRDKTRKLEHPDLYNKTMNSHVNNEILQEITRNTKLILEKQTLAEENRELMNDMKEILNSIREISIKKSFADERSKIIDLLKSSNKPLSQKEIIDRTKIDKETIFKIVSDMDIFKLERGRFTLRNE